MPARTDPETSIRPAAPTGARLTVCTGACGAARARRAARCSARPSATPALLPAAALLPATAHAEVLTVGGSSPGYATIQEALTAADNGDTVEVRSGTYSEALSMTRAIELRAAAGATVVVQLPDSLTAPVLRISAPPFLDDIARLSGIALEGGLGGTLAGGDSTRYGGAVLVAGGAAAGVHRCRLSTSFATYGGGLAALAGATVSIDSTIILDSAASVGGGGLYLAGHADLDSVTVAGNRVSAAAADSGHGGGVHVSGYALLDSVLITGNTVEAAGELVGAGGGLFASGDSLIALGALRVDDNRAARGGGVALGGAGERRLERARLTNNRASLLGGALLVATAASIDSVSATGNAVRQGGEAARSGRGGAIFVGGSGAATLTRLDLRANEAASGGGIAIAGPGDQTLERSLVASNTADQQGGGVLLLDDVGAGTTLDFLTVDSNIGGPNDAGGIEVAGNATVRIRNSIVANTRQGAGIVCGAADLSFNDRWHNASDDLASCPLGPGSLVVDPRYAGGDPLAHAGDTPFDYQLDPRSPCIDAADTLEVEVPIDGGTRADLGAFEFRLGPEIRSLGLDPDDPTQDGTYTTGDAIALVIEGVTSDPSLTVSISGDFSAVDTQFDARSIQVTPRSFTPPAFAYRVTYSLVNAGGLDGEGLPVVVTATSSLGGITADTLGVAIDTSAPATPILDPLPGGVTTALLQVTGSAAGADSVHIFLNDGEEPAGRGAASSEGRFAVWVELPERRNTLSAVAIDSVGNQSSPSAAREVVLVPEIFIEFPKRFVPGDAFVIGAPQGQQHITVTLVNLAGQVIRRLENDAGNQLTELAWDGTNARGTTVNAGPYLARFEITDPGGAIHGEHHALVFMKKGIAP